MARCIKKVVKTTEEWLELRRPRIGGSEISAVVGINPFESKYELYLRKTGQSEDKVENLAMRLGHKLENAVAELLQEEAGYQIIKNTAGNVIYLSEDYPFAEASPDRIAYLPGARKSLDNRCIVEIKTTQKNVDPDNLPEHWICQIQWYMGHTGIHTAVIAWLTAGRDFGYQVVDFSKEFFDYLLEEGRQFMEDMRKGVAPAPVTSQDCRLAYPRQEVGKVSEVNEAVALACERYKDIKTRIKDLEAQKDECEDMLKVAFADAESISYGGLTLATFKAAKDTLKFDARKFQEENPELAQKYMVNCQGARRLVVK